MAIADFNAVVKYLETELNSTPAALPARHEGWPIGLTVYDTKGTERWIYTGFPLLEYTERQLVVWSYLCRDIREIDNDDNDLVQVSNNANNNPFEECACVNQPNLAYSWMAAEPLQGGPRLSRSLEME